jgi:hypothetical protein
MKLVIFPNVFFIKKIGKRALWHVPIVYWSTLIYVVKHSL